MITYNNYKSFLLHQGKNLSEIRKAQTNLVMNATWTNDPTYKRVYILTKDGWKWEDVKYQFHFAQSVAKDNVDYYIQFRPGVHYPIGTYILVPGDDSPELNLTKEELAYPFKQPIEKRTQWWIIVDRDNENAFVRYNILQCNWDFRWVYNGRIHSIYGVVRSAQSYTSGVWRAEKTISLDNLTGCWIPDTYLLFGDKLQELGLDDTRTLVHDQRFLLTTNDLNPKVYQITKIVEVSPQGVLKLSLKQDEYNPKRDNIKLKVCDYYTNIGDMTTKIPDNSILDKELVITELLMDENNELIDQNMIINGSISLGKKYYYQAKIKGMQIPCVWDIRMQDELNEFEEKEKAYYEGLIKTTVYDGNVIMVKPGKAFSLIGKHFKLIASREDGEYLSSIDLGVIK